MGMLERGSSRVAMVLENQDVLEAAVFFQIQNSVAVGPEDILDLFRRKAGEARVVIGGFDNHFMRTDAVHAVEHTVGLAVERALNSEGRELVRNYPHRPARGILGSRRPAVAGAIGLDLRRCLVLVAGTEGAESTLHCQALTGEVGGALGAVGGNDDPS